MKVAFFGIPLNEEGCLMRLQFHKLMDICKLLIIFMTLTIFFYGLIIWVVEKVEPHQRYETPKGRAIKVIQVGEHPIIEEYPTMNSIDEFKNRLFFYYWFGE
jgi:hypothetical protein